MYARVQYEMTGEDLAAILNACKSVPVMMIGGFAPLSPQENANAAWRRLGEKMGFDHMTVRPVPGAGQRFFTAVPSEPEDQRAERLAMEANAKRLAEIARLRREIEERERQIGVLGGAPG